MTTYQDLGGDSGIAEFESGADFIDVRFKNQRLYRYSAAVFGAVSVEEMKHLAIVGDGLNTVINKHPMKKFAPRLN